MSDQEKSAWVSDCAPEYITQQNQNNGISENMSGYAPLTRPTPNLNQLENLPASWLKTSLGKVINYGTVEKAEPCDIQKDAWVLELEDIEKDSSKVIQRLTFSARQSKSTKNRFKKGDVLYGKLRPYLNKVIIADSDGVCSTEIVPMSGNDFLHNRYLFYWLKHPDFLTYVAQVGYGVNMPRLGTKEGIAAPFILAPLAEQHQIATKLDELLAQVDSIKTRLDAIPHSLKRFRQSVLAAAVSGKLTEDLRNNIDYTESGYGWKYPLDWRLLAIDDIAEVKGGKRLPKGENLVSENTGYPYIRAGQLKQGTVIKNNQLYLLEHVQKKISKYIVNSGDLYLTIVGASIGDAGIIPSEYEGANLTENAAKICSFKKPLHGSFLSHWLRSQYLQDIIQNEIKSAAQGKLALKRIKTLPVPYPSVQEQTEIVRRVEQLFAYADQIGQRVKDAQARVNHLTQAILAKAFRGELTADWRAQNPDLISGENSAVSLLKRIKAERESGKSSGKARKNRDQVMS
jgi:type I restriction enzyme S subunit